MARHFLSDPSRQALKDVIRDLERTSGAELVLAVREGSAEYRHTDLMVGVVAGTAVLALLLFVPWDIDLIWFVLDPLAAGAAASLAASRWPGMRRLLTREAERRRRAEIAARSTFVEKRVHRTTHRTGLLLYISLLEREVVAVPDLGLEALAQTPSWQSALGKIQDAVDAGADGAGVAASMADLVALLRSAITRRDDDVDEIEDEVFEQ